MTDFHNVRFPLALAFSANGGPEFTTEITQLASGHEYRNTPHALPRRRYDAVVGIKKESQLYELMKFFINRKGRLYSFRFHDPFDSHSCSVSETPQNIDQVLGIGDGLQTEFQLIKRYDDLEDYSRPITKPIDGSVQLAVNGQAVDEANYIVDELTGIVTLDAPLGLGDTLTAGFSFDAVVRFDTDNLNLSLESFGAGQLQSVPLLEVPYA